MQEPGRHRDWADEEMRGRRERASYPYGYDEDFDSPRAGLMRGEGREGMSARGEWERGFEGRGDFGQGRGWGRRGEERELGGRGEIFGGRDEWHRGGARMDRGRYGRWDEGERGRGWGPSYGYGPGYGGSSDYGRRFGQSFAGESGGMQGRMGEHDLRGKGPKNYRRSDDRIREEVCEMLEDADIDASEIDVKVREGEVTLEGSVKDRWSKREAEDVVCGVRGVKDCHNQLRLEQRSQPSIGRGNGRTSAST